MSTLLKKLSIKHVCGEFKTPAIGEETQLAVFMGYAKSTEKKVTTFGESTAFHGDFKGVNVETGEEFRSGTCYLPDVATDLLKNAMDANNGVVEFGFTISIIGVKGRDGDNGSKYEYRCKPLMEAAENDPMLALENRLKNNAAKQVEDKTARASKSKAAK